MVRAVEVRVSGRVQGVSFRAYAAREARRLGLAGWVKNADDGSVRAHLEGPSEVVEEMLTWCRSGSPAARVSDIEVGEVEASGASSFEVAR